MSFGVTPGLPETAQVSTKLVALYAMMWSICTLLLTAVAFMANRASVPALAAVPEQGLSGAATLTRFVCAKCSETSQLSSLGLFLSRSAVRSHIGALKLCTAAKLGIREIQVDVRTSDGMAGAGGATGPAPNVRLVTPARRYCESQVSCSVCIYLVLTIHITKKCTLVA